LSYNNRNRIYYKTNYYITHPEIRLLDEKGEQIGVMTIEEARSKSRETGLDLVEIAPKAKPPVVKLIDFAKFRYQEEKKRREEKKKSKSGDLKEVKMTPFIGQGDYETMVKRAKKFLTTGNKVKLSIKFLGRQITKKEFGHQLADRFIKDVEEFGQPESNRKFLGKLLIQIITPKK